LRLFLDGRILTFVHPVALLAIDELEEIASISSSTSRVSGRCCWIWLFSETKKKSGVYNRR